MATDMPAPHQLRTNWELRKKKTHLPDSSRFYDFLSAIQSSRYETILVTCLPNSFTSPSQTRTCSSSSSIWVVLCSRSRKRRFLGNRVGYGRVSSLWIGLNESSSDRSGVCSGNSRFLGVTLFCGYASTRVFRKPKKCSFGASFALAWALEQQAIGSEFGDGNLNEINGELGETKITKSDSFCIDGASGTEDNSAEEEKVVDGENAGEVGEEDCSRVDVRSLARRLRLAETADDVEEVLKDKGVLPLRVFCSMIRGFGKEKRIDSAMAVMEWLKRKKEETNGAIYPNLFIYNSLLGAMKQSEQFGELERVVDYMTSEGVVRML
ncbi:hypothetical protein NL676_006224 [Syzygium grande]|nr:hypothetical protein NL676_006224 [Syzygium grande]